MRGSAHSVYKSAGAREWTQRQLAGQLLERAFCGSAKALLIGALAAKKTTKSELAELRQLLNQCARRCEMRLLDIAVNTAISEALGWTLFLHCGKPRLSHWIF
jgi:hypothetical protein